jgi:hypothetical protein
MSYQIYYGKQFVRLSDGRFIPMTLDGSNNCTFMHKGKEIRERDWNCRDYYFRTLGKGEFFATSKDILESVQVFINNVVDNALKSNYRNETETEETIKNQFGYYSGESFGGGCSKLSASRYYTFFKNGIKNALTIEELHNLGIHLKFSFFRWHDYELTVNPPTPKQIETETDFFNELTKWKNFKETCIITEQRENGKTFHPSIYLHYSEPFDFILYQLKNRNPKKELEPIFISQDYFYVLQNEKGFFAGYCRYGYNYTYSVNSRTKFFESEKQVQAYLSKIKYDKQTWKIVCINEKKDFKHYKQVA